MESREGVLVYIKSRAQSCQCSMVKMYLKPTHVAATSQQLHQAKGQISVGKIEGNLNLVNFLPEYTEIVFPISA